MSELIDALGSVVKEHLLPYMLPSQSSSFQNCSNVENSMNGKLNLEFSLAIVRTQNKTNVEYSSTSNNNVEKKAITIELIECQENNSCTVAVLIDKKLLQEEFWLYVREFANSAPLHYDKALYCNKNMNHEHECKLPSASSLPILTSSLVESLSDSWLINLCLLSPAHQQLWNERKRRIIVSLHNTQVSEVSQFKSIHSSTHYSEEIHESFMFNLCKLLHECVLCDLLLNTFHKEGVLWTHRIWIVEQMFSQWHRVDSMMPINSKSNDNVKCKFEEMQICFWRYFVTYDNKTCHVASDAHLMNYNAWLYRRLRYRLLMSMKEQQPWLVEYELSSTFDFAQVHLRDSSALNYLLFVLHSLSSATPEIGVIINYWWRKLFAWTQFAIRCYANYGYESLWMLRGGLVVFACKTTTGLIYSDWMLEDELAWVTTFVDGYYEGENQKCDISDNSIIVAVSSSETETKEDLHHDNRALSKVQQIPQHTSSTTTTIIFNDRKKDTEYDDNDLQQLSHLIQQKVVENGGSSRWNQYYAARYGLQLLSLL